MGSSLSFCNWTSLYEKKTVLLVNNFLFCLCILGHRKAGANTSYHWVQGWVNPGQGATISLGYHKDEQPFTITFTPIRYLKRPVKLISISLDGGREPENLEKTHTGMQRTTSHRKASLVDPGTFFLYSSCPKKMFEWKNKVHSRL